MNSTIKPRMGLCSHCNDGVVKHLVGKFCVKEHGRLKAIRYAEKARSKPVAPRKSINKVSAKEKKRKADYAALRAKMIILHPICEMSVPGICSGETTTVHHAAGRLGDKLLDVTTWRYGCWPCHEFYERHPDLAKARNVSLNRLTKQK